MVNMLHRMAKMETLTVGKPGVSRRAALSGGAALAMTSFPGMPAYAADQPKRGGRFRIGLAGGGTNDNLDPRQSLETVTATLSFQFRNTLVELLPTMRPGPELAERWESSPDAKTWIFDLRKGVQFHSGKTFDSEDVIYSINHHRGGDRPSAAAGFVRPIVDIKADGKSRVIFTLNGPNADFPLILSEYRLPILEAGTTNFTVGNGTGAYILKSFEPGVRAFAVKNPNYWRNDR